MRNRNELKTAASYVLDWAVILAFAVGGGYMSTMRGFRRPFSLADRSIAYPRHADIVTIQAAGIACFVAPAAIILVLSLITPGIRKPGQKRLLYSSWRDKLWDANAGWLGLGLALASTLFITSGMKAIVGKPRPNFLAICNADVDNLRDFVVGGSGSSIESDAPALVSYEICRQTDLNLLNDAFFAFPSGHSSMSWAGLLYLSLWLAMKFCVTIPYLGHQMPVPNKSTEDVDIVSYYHERKAAPPLWMVTIVLLPIGTALFICTSRYADFHHAGIDIFAGCVIGIISGWASFRLYHLPVRRGHGMAWGPRSEGYTFLGDVPWKHTLKKRDSFSGPSDEESRGERDARVSTSAEEMLEYRNGRVSGNNYPMQRDSGNNYPMQTMPHSTLDSSR